MARFAKGTSGNPHGRKKGIRNRFAGLVQRLMEESSEAVAQAMVDAARGGDVQAGKLVLDRVAPVRRGTPIPFDMPKIEVAADVVAAIATVGEQVAAGLLSPDEGALIGGLIETHRRAIETAQLEARIARLEARDA